MDANTDDLRSHYSNLNDTALLAINPDELIDAARTCLAEEIAKRGLTRRSAGVVEAEAEEPVEAGPPPELVLIGEYEHPDEAGLARGLLESAGIVCTIEGQHNIPPMLQLKVGAEDAGQAFEILASPLTDEELAAQAEAAGAE